MPAPALLAPIAWKAVQIGVVAALGAYAARRFAAVAPEAGPQEIWRERALDDVTEGLRATTTREGEDARTDAAGRLRGAVRLGATGPGVAYDLTALARLRLRRLR